MSSLSTKVVFALVSFFLGQLGDGLNIFQGIYLVGLGWNEGSVGTALSLMGLTALVVQTFAGDIIDKTHFDRRAFLSLASVATAFSASAVLFVHKGNRDHLLMYATKVIEGVASSFIGPCLAALTLATFGPGKFDEVMASNILWGHVGSVASAGAAGYVGWLLYPDIKLCFLVIGASALLAVGGVQFLPEGDPLLGRGLQVVGRVPSFAENGEAGDQSEGLDLNPPTTPKFDCAGGSELFDESEENKAASYWTVFGDRKTLVLCLTGFFFHSANANVLLVLGEMMGGGGGDDGQQSRSAIPNVAASIVIAQVIMSFATYVGDVLTKRGVGRKPLFLVALLSLPLRCALIIAWRDAGDKWLLSTQVLDGLGGGFFGLIHPYLVNDIAFGSGRFNVLMGLTASCFGIGATLSNFLGQIVVENFGHIASIIGSLVISVIPVVLFSLGMPETLGKRGGVLLEKNEDKLPDYGTL